MFGCSYNYCEKVARNFILHHRRSSLLSIDGGNLDTPSSETNILVGLSVVRQGENMLDLISGCTTILGKQTACYALIYAHNLKAPEYLRP